MRKLLFFSAVFASLLVSCAGGSQPSTHENGGDTLSMRYATLLGIVEHGMYTEVTIRDPWNEGKQLAHYALVPYGEKGDAYLRDDSLPAGMQLVRVPVKRAIVFTSPHCALFYELGAAQAIAGVCDLQYINLPGLRARKDVADCGSSMSPDIERIVEAKADAMFVSPFENASYGKLPQVGVPIIATADYMETSSLGRAEWMRFYGMLLGKRETADSLFHVVDSVYQGLRAQARKLPQGRKMLTERKTGSVWYCPGGNSTIGRMLADAHAGYAFANDTHAGSLSLSAEQVLDKAGDVDVWAFKYNGGAPLTRKQLLEEYHGYDELRAFKTGEIYECEVNATRFFEETSFHPEYLLRDFIMLAHPGILPGSLRYYIKLDE